MRIILHQIIFYFPSEWSKRIFGAQNIIISVIRLSTYVKSIGLSTKITSLFIQ